MCSEPSSTPSATGPFSHTGVVQVQAGPSWSSAASVVSSLTTEAGFIGACALCASRVRPLPASCTSSATAPGGTRARCNSRSTSGGNGAAGAPQAASHRPASSAAAAAGVRRRMGRRGRPMRSMIARLHCRFPPRRPAAAREGVARMNAPALPLGRRPIKARRAARAGCLGARRKAEWAPAQGQAEGPGYPRARAGTAPLARAARPELCGAPTPAPAATPARAP